MLDTPTKPRSRWARPLRPIPLRFFTDRDLATLRFFAQYRFLDAPHVCLLHGNGNVREMAARLRGIANAHLLSKPFQQQNFLRSLYRPLIFQLDTLGRKVLEEHEIDDKPVTNFPHVFTEFAHNVMLSQVLASISAGAKKHGVEFISYHGNLGLPVADTYLIPDAIFTLKHADGKLLHFALEVDCSTEQNAERKDPARPSYHKKLNQYKEVITKGTFREYGFGHLFICHVTNKPTRMKNIQQLCGPSKSNVFKTHPKLGDHVINRDGTTTTFEAPADGSMFGTWERVGHPDFQM